MKGIAQIQTAERRKNMRRIIDRISGLGILQGEGRDNEVSYALVVEQDVIDSRTMQNPSATIPGMETISGRVKFIHPMQEPTPSAEKFILRLDDGRQLHVFYVGRGQLKATGGFF